MSQRKMRERERVVKVDNARNYIHWKSSMKKTKRRDKDRMRE